ncbi:MAG: uroporphyrinogen decarboxylase [Alphaproteobacteria bacterium]
MENFITKKKTPIWFMRQAGRYLPEYRKLRAKEASFLDMCFNSKLAAEISLQPIRRFNLDFVILFSDILVIPHALNQKVDFKEGIGPVLDPITSIKELNFKNFNRCLEKLSSVFETIQLLKEKKKEKKLIGFCGGPFTVLTYMIQGRTSKTHLKIKSDIKSSRKKLLEILEVLIELSVHYLNRQIKEGADLVMVFDSWAGILDNEDYEDFVIKPNKKIQELVKRENPKIPMIFFPRNSGEKIFEFLKNVKCDILSISQNYPLKLLELAKKKNIILQGNLNPVSLLNGGKNLDKEIKKIMEDFKNNKHIFNLSHGVLPQTPIENVERTIKQVREFK